jgi:flagellin FlaB
MRRFFKILRRKDVGSIGIGAMIVFIAMVLVAGIAASVLIQTSTRLESQAMLTGQQTTEEVATGLAVFDIAGYAETGQDINLTAITIRPRAGSDEVDLSQSFVEISDTNYKIVLEYDSGSFVEDAGAGKDDVFSQAFFPTTANQFGVLVLEDADDSCTSGNPVINRGDKVILGVNTSAAFLTGIAERTKVWGMVIPEVGSPGIISFTTPPSYFDPIIDLQ